MGVSSGPGRFVVDLLNNAHAESAGTRSTNDSKFYGKVFGGLFGGLALFVVICCMWSLCCGKGSERDREMRRERESNAGHGSNNSSNNSSNNKLASWPVRRPEPILRAPPSYTSQLPPYSAEDPVNQINEINPAEPQQPLEPLEPPKKAATK